MILLDDFLPSHLTNHVKHFENIRWWDGVTKSEPAHDVIEFCVDYFQPEGMCGFEYWYNICHHEHVNSWHFDKDEEKGLNGKFVPADWSCVLYSTEHSLWGGFLEIQTADETRTEVERIAPRFNRFVVLDPGVWHRVSGIWSGERHAFLINGWRNPPTTAQLHEENK